MISNIGALIETIEDNEKLIAYMKKAYKEKTGEDIVIPDLKALAERQLRKHEDVETHPNLKFNSFKDKVIALNLPDIKDRETRMRLDKLRRLKDTKILIKKLDISHFAGKDITPELLYTVLDGLKALRSVEEVNLSHNNLGDNFIDVISDYLMLKGLYRINLSYNNLTKASVKKLVATLKGCRRLESIDVSYNPFNLDEYSCILICSSLKECDKIVHFGINDSSRESGLRFINNHPSLTSVNLEDSRYKKRAWGTLSRIISNKRKYKINRLSLKFCKIDLIFAVPPLIRAFKKNVTLMYLNLYNTGLDDFSGAQIISAFCNHKFLEELDLGANFLCIHFCKAFGRVLRVNNILRKVNITKNHNISRDDYFYILEGLVNNQSILSLGDLIDMKIGVKCRECTEKLLNLNKCSEWRNLENIKSQKANLYMSNVGLEHIQSENKKLEQKKKEEDEKKENDEKDKKDTNNNLFFSRGYSYSNNNIYADNKVIPVISSNNSIDQNPNIDTQKNKINIILPEKNSNHIDVLINKLPEGTMNKYYQESLKNQFSYTNDINTIIGNMNLSHQTQSINNFNSRGLSTDKNLSSSNYNNQGKYIVPYSIANSHIIKDLQQYEEEMSKGKKRKKTTYNAKSAGKYKRQKGRRNPPTIVNTIASIAQELIDNDEDLKEFKNSPPKIEKNDNNIYNQSEINNNTDYRNFNLGNDEIMNYGKINLEEIQSNPEDEKDIISKYNLIENNFSTDFQEQIPFYY